MVTKLSIDFFGTSSQKCCCGDNQENWLILLYLTTPNKRNYNMTKYKNNTKTGT